MIEPAVGDSILKQAGQHWRFFRAWMRAPLSTASVVPSSRFLAKKMLAEVPSHARSVIELGAGTGVFTKQLLARSAPLKDVYVVELNSELAHNLEREFPAAHIINGDARFVQSLLSTRPGFVSGEIDAVISGLGFLSMPNDIVRDIVAAAFSVMRPDAPFVQFTYGPRSPIADHIARDLGLSFRRASFTLRNFPPASIYVYRKR